MIPLCTNKHVFVRCLKWQKENGRWFQTQLKPFLHDPCTLLFCHHSCEIGIIRCQLQCVGVDRWNISLEKVSLSKTKSKSVTRILHTGKKSTQQWKVMWQFPVIFAPMQIISNFTETDCMSSSPTEHWAVGKEYCLFLFFFSKLLTLH